MKNQSSSRSKNVRAAILSPTSSPSSVRACLFEALIDGVNVSVASSSSRSARRAAPSRASRARRRPGVLFSSFSCRCRFRDDKDEATGDGPARGVRPSRCVREDDDGEGVALRPEEAIAIRSPKDNRIALPVLAGVCIGVEDTLQLMTPPRVDRLTSVGVNVSPSISSSILFSIAARRISFLRRAIACP